MLKIKEIDGAVASREMQLRFEDGRTETFLVRVGMPYEYGGALTGAVRMRSARVQPTVARHIRDRALTNKLDKHNGQAISR